MKATIALAQISPFLGDVKKNLEQHVEIASGAKKSGAEFIAFPELSLSGYLLKDLVPQCALRLDSQVISCLKKESRDIAFLVGLVEEAQDYRFYNSAVFIQGGEIKHVHRKIYLPTYGMFEEMRYFAWGDSFRAFDTIFGKMAVLICEDAWHPSIPYIAAMDGAEIMVAIHNSPVREVTMEGKPANYTLVEDIGKICASLYGIYFLSVNRVGCENGITFSGGSMIIEPSGNIQSRAQFLNNEILIGEIDERKVRQARLSFPLLRDEKMEILQNEIKRIKDEKSTSYQY